MSDDQFHTLLTTGRRDPDQPWALYSLPEYEAIELPWTTETEFLVVVNHYDYDVSWAKRLKFPHIIYTKNQPDKEPFNAINKGKSEINLLKLIYQFYDSLPQNIIVVHQYETKHYHEGSLVDVLNDESFVERYAQCPTPGYYSFNIVPMSHVDAQLIKMKSTGWWAETMKPWFGDMNNYGDWTYGKASCAQFVVSRTRIHSLPREFYSNMYNWMVNNTLDEAMPNHVNKERDRVSTDGCWTSNFHTSRYLEWTWELIFATHKLEEEVNYILGQNNLLVLYGAKSLYIDVTPIVIKLFYKQSKIVIPAEVNFNAVFSDPIAGSVKQLTVRLNGKSHHISENRSYETVIMW